MIARVQEATVPRENRRNGEVRKLTDRCPRDDRSAADVRG